jgi:hypothetical protein
MYATIHLLTGTLFIKDRNIMLCIDQFGNEAALHQEGEFSEWNISNYTTQNGKVEVTSPLPFLWEIAELPISYEGALTVGFGTQTYS